MKKEEAFLYFFCSVFRLEKEWISLGCLGPIFGALKGWRLGVAAIEKAVGRFR